MAKCDKKRALRIIVDAAKKYEKKLNDRHFLIVYNECTYLSNAQHIDKLPVSEDVRLLIQV